MRRNAAARIGRPAAPNPRGGATTAVPGETFHEVRRDASMRGMILAGAGERAFAAGADIAASLFGPVCGAGNAKEGRRAFLERRKPEFRGR
jgi:enoyl-CoA hydratase/carnithine racemase